MEFQPTSFLIFLTIYFIAFDFISLSDLNYNLNSVLINVILINLNLSHFALVSLLDNCLMCLNISLIAFKISKSSLSILINLQPIFFYCFLSLHFIAKIHVTMTILINFYCKFMMMKI